MTRSLTLWLRSDALIFCVFLMAILHIGSCQIKSSEKEDDQIVSVFNKSLTETNLRDYFSGQLSDSIQRNQYIQQWIRDQIISEHAKKSVASLDKINKLTDDYRNALIVQEYQENYLSKQLNKEIEESELQQYLQDFDGDFKTKKSQIRLFLCKIPADDPGLALFSDWWDSENLEELKRFCSDHDFMCLLDKDKWYNLSEIEIILPESLHKAFEKGKNLNQKKDKFEYFVKTFDNRSKSGEASLELHRDLITQRILFARKQTILESLHDSLYHNAFEKNKVKLY